MQWREKNIAPPMVFEILSSGNTLTKINKKQVFYDRYGVEEYYLYDPERNDLSGWLRSGDRLDVGVFGWPYYPGSSMKGIFRRVCTPEQAARYCGKDISKGDFEPGILRFPGGYPIDKRWQKNLVDIIHPQQKWQVKNDEKLSAFVQIFLYKTKLNFGICSTISLKQTEWETIWNILGKALSPGIGCRVIASYGLPKKHAVKLYIELS